MNIEEKVKQCTVKLHHQENSHIGTGFFVAPSLIVTCVHVVNLAKGKPIFAYNYQQERIELNLVYSSEDKNQLDLALLEVVNLDQDFNYLQLDSFIENKDKFYSYGFPEKYPQGDPNTFEYIGKDGQGLIKFKLGNVKRGASGSPLLNLSTNKVCGMIIRTLDNELALGGRAISAEVILTILPQLNPYHLSIKNPFIPISGVIKNSQLLFAREGIIREVFEYLNAGSGVALIGETGTGKSSLLKAISEQCHQLHEPRKPVILNLGLIRNDDEYYDIMCDLLEIKPVVKYYQFVRKLQELERQEKKFLLLIDTAENLTWEGFTLPLRNQIRSIAENSLRLVVTGNKSLNQMFIDSGLGTSPFEGICIEIKLPLWNEVEMREFIAIRLAKTQINFTEAEIQNLISESKGNPRRLMQLCHQCFTKYALK